MKKLDSWIKKIDRAPLFLLLFPLLCLFFSYYFLLGENICVEIHDQLDERVVYNVINAKHLFDGAKIFPEMFAGGIPKGGLVTSSITYVFYRFLSPLQAFMLDFLFAETCAFLGMYACVKHVSKSSIMASLAGCALMWVNFRPAYGLSLVGSPIIIFAFLDLLELSPDLISKRTFRLRLVRDCFLILFYGLTTHFAWVGYAVCAIFVLSSILLFWKSHHAKQPARYLPFYAGSLLIILTYVAANKELFIQTLFPGGFVSHRTEFSIHSTYPFAYALNLILYGDGDNVATPQRYLLIPLLFFLILYGARYKKCSTRVQKLYRTAVALFLFNLLVALFYGFCGTAAFHQIKESLGILKAFEFNRFYWLYPGTWYLCDAIVLLLPAVYHSEEEQNSSSYSLKGRWPLALSWLFILLLLSPTAWEIRQNSNWLLNKSQYKNHMNVGLISWKDYYSPDLMEEIRIFIGRDQSTYRVASLGIQPSVPQVAGFYTIDGYSNNYPLEYKHKFRKIIEKELDKNETNKTYYDSWGNRVYLFTAESPVNYGCKYQDFVYDNLELDTVLMRKMGCEYIFAAAPVLNAEELNLALLKEFDTEESFYHIYLYQIRQPLN